MSKKILIYTEGKSDKNFLGWYLNFLKCEDRFDIFDIEGKVKNEYKEDYERLKKAIKFESDILFPLKNFLGQFAENY
ncbi:hypothetical protein HG566_01795 [Helicobacter pylori]|nr:hypothetical protein [Helicobacter pylori]QQW87613.1 hypothetical protein HG566_01795 [Helicobacter pylori]